LGLADLPQRPIEFFFVAHFVSLQAFFTEFVRVDLGATFQGLAAHALFQFVVEHLLRFDSRLLGVWVAQRVVWKHAPVLLQTFQKESSALAPRLVVLLAALLFDYLGELRPPIPKVLYKVYVSMAACLVVFFTEHAPDPSQNVLYSKFLA
jgi:uncharacterized membrane protein